MDAITTDRPGPASVEIPLDLLIGDGGRGVGGGRAGGGSLHPIPEAVDRAAELLAEARMRH